MKSLTHETSPSSASPRILLVEDDPKLADLVKRFLESNSLFTVTIERRGDIASDRIVAERPDLVLLDLMLPGLDGFEVCKAVRPLYEGPILMLTARDEEVDEIVGLEIGADDYLTKPVNPRLLLSRIRAHLRRSKREAPGREREGAQRIELGALFVDPSMRTATMNDQALDLTTAEFDLLLLLAQHAGEIVDRDTLYRRLRGISWDGCDRSIDQRITRLRQKLGDDAAQPEWIKSIRGVGYQLVAVK